MSKASKRERQRLNREERRQAELAASRRRKQMRAVRNGAILLLPLVAIFIVVQVTGSGSSAGGLTCQNVKTPAPKNQSFPSPPPMQIDPTRFYTATIETSCGTIELALESGRAPQSVNNFVFLARQGFYDNVMFARAARDFVAQAGSPQQTTQGGPGYSLKGEVPQEGGGYQVGSVAFTKGDAEPAGTEGSQFFIVTHKSRQADKGLNALNRPPFQYAIIGLVTKGLKVAQKIESFAPASGDGPPTKTVVIKKVTIKESAPPSSNPPPSS